MKTIREEIGNTTIFIQAIDDDVVILGEKRSGRATKPTGIEDKIQPAYAKVKAVIKEIAEDIGAELENLSPSIRPRQVEMEFNLGISAQVGPILLSGKGEYGLLVRMRWELKKEG